MGLHTCLCACVGGEGVRGWPQWGEGVGTEGLHVSAGEGVREELPADWGVQVPCQEAPRPPLAPPAPPQGSPRPWSATAPVLLQAPLAGARDAPAALCARPAAQARRRRPPRQPPRRALPVRSLLRKAAGGGTGGGGRRGRRRGRRPRRAGGVGVRRAGQCGHRGAQPLACRHPGGWLL